MDIKQISDKVNHIAKNWQEFAVKQDNKTKKLEYLEKKMNDLALSQSSPFMANMGVAKKSELANYIRKGEMTNFSTKSLSSTTDDNGGYLVMPHLYQQIISTSQAKSPMRNLASIERISSNSLELIIEQGGFAAGWVGEEKERDVTDSSKLTKKKIMVHEMYAQPKATQRLLDDAEIDIEKWLLERLEDSFLRVENKSFIHGSGDNEPFGILHYREIILNVKAQQKGKVQIEDLHSIVNSMEEQYLANATFLMNRRTFAEIQKIKDANGRFILQPALSEKTPETLLGLPVICAADMPDLTEGSLAIALADFNACYKIVEKQGIAVMRDPYTEKPFVKFYAVKRVGGDVVNPNAIKLLQF